MNTGHQYPRRQPSPRPFRSPPSQSAPIPTFAAADQVPPVLHFPTASPRSTPPAPPSPSGGSPAAAARSPQRLPHRHFIPLRPQPLQPIQQPLTGPKPGHQVHHHFLPRPPVRRRLQHRRPAQPSVSGQYLLSERNKLHPRWLRGCATCGVINPRRNCRLHPRHHLRRHPCQLCPSLFSATQHQRDQSRPRQPPTSIQTVAPAHTPALSLPSSRSTVPPSPLPATPPQTPLPNTAPETAPPRAPPRSPSPRPHLRFHLAPILSQQHLHNLPRRPIAKELPKHSSRASESPYRSTSSTKCRGSQPASAGLRKMPVFRNEICRPTMQVRKVASPPARDQDRYRPHLSVSYAPATPPPPALPPPPPHTSTPPPHHPTQLHRIGADQQPYGPDKNSCEEMHP